MKKLTLCMLMLCVISACRTAKQAKAIPSVNNKISPANDSPPILTVADSLAYIDSLVNNKDKYLNKPLEVLLKDLRLNIESYSSDHQNQLTSTGITIGFTKSTYLIDDKSERINGIIITWKTPISRAYVWDQLKRAGGEWGTAEVNFYSKLIVGDIL